MTDKDGNPVPYRHGVGVIFTCPCGTHKPDDFDVEVFVQFTPTLDGTLNELQGHSWKRESGDTFENLTLSPSILRLNNCRWHGFITNGEVITV